MRDVTMSAVRESDITHMKTRIKSDDNMRYNVWGRFVLKNASYPLVWLFLNLGISANKVTGFAFLLGCVGCFLLASGIYGLMIAGVMLLNLWALIDYADGQVARWNKTSGNYGRFLDNIADIAMGGLLFLCLGIGIFNSYGVPLYNVGGVWTIALDDLTVNLHQWLYLMLGGCTSIFYLYTYIVSYNFERLISPQLTEFVSSMKVRWLPSNLVQILGFNLQNITGIVMPVLLVGSIFRFLPVVLILWTVISMGGMGFMAYSTIKRAKTTVGGKE